MANIKVQPISKICAYSKCNSEFLVGGRGRSPKKTKYCSKRCTALARIIQPTVISMEEKDRIYLAGIFDGEGSVILWDRGYGGRPQLRATIANTDKPLMDYISQATQTGSIVIKDYPEETGYKRSYTWQCYGQNAAQFLMQLLPYLIVKKDKATAGIKSQEVL